MACPLRHDAIACVTGATDHDPASAHDVRRAGRRSGRGSYRQASRRRGCGVRHQVEFIPTDRVHATAPCAPQRERMPARRRAVAAAGTREVAITPIFWEAHRIAGAGYDGPTPRRDGDGFQKSSRHRDRRSVHVEHDSLVGDPNDAVPRAAAQPAIYVTLETSPLQLVGDCPMFRPWHR